MVGTIIQSTIHEFAQALESHLLEARRAWRETECRTTPTPGTLGNKAMEGQSLDYLDAVSDLHGKTSACLGLQQHYLGQEVDRLRLSSPELIWMLPAFCYSSYFMDPFDAMHRCIAIQKIRSPRIDTDDIWAERPVDAWASSGVCSLLLIQGNSQTTKHLEKFAVEIIDALHLDELGNPSRVVYILNPSPRHNFAHPARCNAPEVLRQVVIQSLRYVTPKCPVAFLVDLYAKFKGASTSEDWFAILQEILLMIPSLYIIVDLAILGQNYEEAQSWPTCIQKLLNNLENAGTQCCLKVMLLSCRKINTQFGAVVPVKGVPYSSTTPNRYRVQKRRDTLPHLKKPFLGKKNMRVIPEYPTNHVDSSMVDASNPTSYLNGIEGTVSQTAKNTRPTNFSESKESQFSEPRHRDDFKVGIICALSLEAAAVMAMFDHVWDPSVNKYGRAPGDTNTYSTGAMGSHNVVLVYAPGMGKSNASSVAAHCQTSFRNIGLMLVVGICGGVPLPKSGDEIILGDVVISTGLIQYDFGRQFPDKFTMRGTMSQPKDEIKSLFTFLTGAHGLRRIQGLTKTYLGALQENAETREIAEYPGVEKDMLYEATYRHKHQAPTNCQECSCCLSSADPTCEAALQMKCEDLQCGVERLVPRRRLSETGQGHPEPRIHFGHYASGDSVMKCGEKRDRIAKGKEEVIAFEMEGSGVWNRFPSSCLVIKGVCDYADSHKNKGWQAYASATAAACTKAFLQDWAN